MGFEGRDYKNFSFSNTTHSVIVSKALMYFFHVGVLNSLQSGNLSSRTPTFEKNVITASISFCVSEVQEDSCSSRQPRRMSRATRAIAVSQKEKVKIPTCIKV